MILGKFCVFRLKAVEVEQAILKKQLETKRF